MNDGYLDEFSRVRFREKESGVGGTLPQTFFSGEGVLLELPQLELPISPSITVACRSQYSRTSFVIAQGG